jgi:hypothetical protein
MILRSGKYKGQSWTDVQQFDPGYIRWIRENRPEMLKFSKPKVNKVVEAEEDEYIQSYKNLPLIDPLDAF